MISLIRTMSIKCWTKYRLSDNNIVCRPTTDSLKMALAIGLMFLFSHTGAEKSQLSVPQNTLSAVGSSVILKCSSPSRDCNGIEWLKFYGGNQVTVFNDRGMILPAYNASRDRYSVDNSSGCDLVIKNVQLTDAGRFICRIFISSSTVDGAAYLIIMKNNLTCATNASLNDTVDRDGVQLTCEVTFNGTNRASVVWEGVADATDAVKPGSTIKRSDLVVASAPKVPSFTCNTSFVVETNHSDGRRIEGLATNMPITTCETPSVRVKYSPRDVQLSQSLSNYPPGSVITCSAKGDPSPTFRWQISENGVTWMDIPNKNSSEFSTNDVSSRRYRCVAMNVVRGKSYDAPSMEFQVNNSDDSGSVTVTPTPLPLILIASIGAGIGVAILLLLIIVLVVCFCVRSCPGYRCRHAEKTSNGKIREMQPLTENNPDIYSNIEEVNHGAPKAKPRSAPTSQPPNLPKGQPPQAKPRTDNPKKAGNMNAAPYVHEEVTYADLALESGQRQVIPKNNQPQPETLYAAVGTA